MQVTIYVKEEALEELHHFITSAINYEHTIDFLTYQDDLFEGVATTIFYDDLVRLKDFKMRDKNDPLP